MRIRRMMLMIREGKERRGSELRMGENPLDYSSSPSPPSDAIIMTSFPDGGVTVVVPQYRRQQWPFAKIIAIALGGSLGFFFSCLVLGKGSIPRGIRLELTRAPAIWRVFVSSPITALIIISPLAWICLRWITESSRSKPTIIGISPSTVLIDFPGWIRRRRVELRRSRLQRIEIGRYYGDKGGERGDLGGPRFIEFSISGRMTISVCHGRPMKDLRIIADSLNKAMDATSRRI